MHDSGVCVRVVPKGLKNKQETGMAEEKGAACRVAADSALGAPGSIKR